MAKVKRLTFGTHNKDIANMDAGIRFTCPGCGMTHHLYTQDTPAVAAGPRWHFNGDLDAPVLTPSILAKGAFLPNTTDDEWDSNAICHSFVGCNGAQPGEIIFLGDCTHALAGKTVPLPDIEV